MSENLNLEQFVENLLAGWFGSGNDAHISTTAIQNAAAEAGYNPADVQGLDMKAIYQNACEHPGVPADYRSNADNYSGPNDVEHVIRQIQQVTEVHNFNQQFNAPSQRLTGGSHGVGYVVIGICTVVGAPFFEELFFRGVLLRSLARLFGDVGRWVGPALAIVVTGVLFGLAHAESLQLLGLALFGVILSFIAYRTGRLGMNMVAHATFNLMAVAAVVAPLSFGARALF